MTPAEPQAAPADGDADDALTWGDEADSSHVEGPASAVRRRRGRDGRDGLDASGDEATADREDGDREDDDDEVDDGPAVMSSGSLVAHGVLGGVFLLWAAGWIVAVGDFTNPFTDAISSVLWNLGELFAVAAPIAWFVAVIVLVPVDRTGRRLAWMALGALLVAPWPLVIGGSA